ncbi:MAG: sigma-70 family RNA polymerase sigma factor [Sedimentisphaerales bacterium]|nr:sigma-70 family RNA polymerase sigma factor [Sedimentisphaerales bacterium]
MSESENILLHRFVATGDAEAFSEIVRRHAGLVYGACLRVLADKDRAADAVQETFLQLLHNARTITGSVPAWLHRVATRKAVDLIRRDSTRRRHEAGYAADKPHEVTQWRDLSRYVDEGLDELDEQMRQILIRRFFEGATTNDIAAAHGLSQPTVSRRIESGINQLRDKLRRRGVIVGAAVLAGLIGENAVQAAPAVVLKELGKIALVGGQTAASVAAGSATAAGTTAATASGAGAKIAAGVLAGVKAKVVAAAAVTVVGVGSVVTYNHVTAPSKPQPSASPAVAGQYTQNQPSGSQVVVPTLRRPDSAAAQTKEQMDWSQLDQAMWEQIFAEETAAASPARTAAATARPDRSAAEAPTGGYYMGGYGGKASAKAGDGEMQDTSELGMGGGMMMGGMGYAGTYELIPIEPNESEEQAGERGD